MKKIRFIKCDFDNLKQQLTDQLALLFNATLSITEAHAIQARETLQQFYSSTEMANTHPGKVKWKSEQHHVFTR